MRMLQDRVMVRRHETKQAGRIFIPEIAQEKALIAEVVAVGPGKTRIDESGEYFQPTVVKVGQKVVLSPSMNKTWPDVVDTNGCTVIQEADILGIL